MPEPVTLTFDPALEWQGKTWESMTIGRGPTGAELLQANREGDQGDFYMLSQITGVPLPALMKADGAVLLEASDVLKDFLSVRQVRKPGAT